MNTSNFNNSRANPYVVHVAGKTPGPFGKAPMVAVANGVEHQLEEDGSHHKAVYLAAIIAMAAALENGIGHIVITSPSEHLVKQMNGEWDVGPELETVHDAARAVAALLESAEFRLT